MIGQCTSYVTREKMHNSLPTATIAVRATQRRENLSHILDTRWVREAAGASARPRVQVDGVRLF